MKRRLTRLGRAILLCAAIAVPGSLTAGPRVDFTGKWCSKCCEAWCPYDGIGFYRSCFPEFDGTSCEYNDGHFLFAGGC
jgi:hypothetical protein